MEQQQVNVAQVVRDMEALEAHSLDTWYEVIGQVYSGSAGQCQQRLDYDLASKPGSVFEEEAAQRLAELGRVASQRLGRINGPQAQFGFEVAAGEVASALGHLQTAYKRLQDNTDSSVSGGVQVELGRVQQRLRQMEVYLDGMAEPGDWGACQECGSPEGFNQNGNGFICEECFNADMQ